MRPAELWHAGLRLARLGEACEVQQCTHCTCSCAMERAHAGHSLTSWKWEIKSAPARRQLRHTRNAPSSLAPSLNWAKLQNSTAGWFTTVQYSTQPVHNLCQLYVQVLTCYHPEDGGFGASPRNDSHMLATLSALQILALLDELHRVEADRVVACE